MLLAGISVGLQIRVFVCICCFLNILVAQTVKRLPTVLETRFHPWVRKVSWKRERQPTPVFLPTLHQKKEGVGLKEIFGFSCGSVGKDSACNAENRGSIPRSGRSPGEGHGNPLQYSCLENSKDSGVGRVAVHRIAKSQIRLQPSFTWLPWRLRW